MKKQGFAKTLQFISFQMTRASCTDEVPSCQNVTFLLQCNILHRCHEGRYYQQLNQRN